MYDPQQILDWIETHVHPMRRSRRKTLAALVASAMQMRGVGVLALGRAMAGAVGAKHCIKRVWRFLRNDQVECEAVAAALLRRLAPCRGPIVVLVDWTDLSPFMQLVFALPRSGRSLPFLCRTIAKKAGSGSMVEAEEAALAALERICPPGRQLVLVADRGFGHTRWLESVKNRGWSYVQRLSGRLYVEKYDYFGQLKDLGVRRGSPSRDHGLVQLTLEKPLTSRVVTTFARKAKEPWYLATNLDVIPQEVTRLYRLRMAIEETFRDWKNRNWGLGLDVVRLSEPARHDRLFVVLALAYTFLCAFGAAAEQLDLDRLLKANTSRERVLNLARMGNYFLQIARCRIQLAVAILAAMPP